MSIQHTFIQTAEARRNIFFVEKSPWIEKKLASFYFKRQKGCFNDTASICRKKSCLEVPCFIFYQNLSRVLLLRPLGTKCIRLKEKLFLKANWWGLCFYQWKAFVFVPKVIGIQNQGNCVNLQRHFLLFVGFIYIYTYTYMNLIN